MKGKKRDNNMQDWLKVIVGLAFVIAATAETGHLPGDPAQQPATTCVTLRALSRAGPVA